MAQFRLGLACWNLAVFLSKMRYFNIHLPNCVFIIDIVRDAGAKLGQGKSGLSLASARACTLSTRMKISIFSFFFQYLCLFENKSLIVTFLKMHINCLTNYKRQDISIDRERSYWIECSHILTGTRGATQSN